MVSDRHPVSQRCHEDSLDVVRYDVVSSTDHRVTPGELQGGERCPGRRSMAEKRIVASALNKVEQVLEQ